MFYQFYKNKILPSGGLVLIPSNQWEKISPYGSKLIQNIYRLQMLQLISFSIRELELQLPKQSHHPRMAL